MRSTIIPTLKQSQTKSRTKNKLEIKKSKLKESKFAKKKLNFKFQEDFDITPQKQNRFSNERVKPVRYSA